MMLRGEGVAQTVRVPSYRGVGGGLVSRQITFIVAKKLNLQFICSIYGMCGEGVG